MNNGGFTGVARVSVGRKPYLRPVHGDVVITTASLRDLDLAGSYRRVVFLLDLGDDCLLLIRSEGAWTRRPGPVIGCRIRCIGVEVDLDRLLRKRTRYYNPERCEQ